MASTESLDRRMTRTEEDLTAISDTLISVKSVVDSHTKTLGEIKATVAKLETTVNAKFAEILRLLQAR
jgi:archaellum component FlaC